MIRTRTAALLLALPFALTACGGGDTEPEPAPTVTVTAEPEIRTETVETTPQSCLEALDAAERLSVAVTPALQNGADLALLVSEAYSAGFLEGATGDSSGSDAVVAEAKRITESMDAATPEFEAAVDEYRVKAEECRAASQ